MKYDCTKTEDYIHELNRLCLKFHDMGQCSLLCPLKAKAHCRKCDFGTIKEVVEIVQKWSNMNPESMSNTEALEWLRGIGGGNESWASHCGYRGGKVEGPKEFVDAFYIAMSALKKAVENEKKMK